MDQAVSLQFADGCWITAETIPRDNARRPVVWIRQSLLQKAFRGFPITRFRKVEIHGLPVTVHCPEQVQPTTANPNERFVDVPSGRLWFQISA
jgi:hypothetical protein